MTKMEKLQAEYNKVAARLANMKNEANIAAANRVLDRIVAEMEGVA